MKDQIVPAPLAGTHVTAIDRQRGHIGRGGMRHAPHAPQVCTSSSPRAVPAQNGAEVSSSRSGSRKPVSLITSPPEENRRGGHALAAGDERAGRVRDLAGGGAAD